MAHITLIARINDGNGKFPFVNVEFTKNHRPIAIEGATYYLRASSGNRKPVHVGKDIDAACAALHNSEPGKIVVVGMQEERSAETAARKTVRQAADGYIEQSRGLGRKTYLGYRAAANLFLLFCKKEYLDEIRRDDMVNFKAFLRTHVSAYTDEVFEPSTVFNYFLKVMVFLNDVGIAKYVPDKEWVRMKDWPPNVDKKNKNKKYAVYTEAEFTSLLSVTNLSGEALLRFLAGTGYRIGEVAVAQWGDIDWKAKTISVLFKPQFKFKPKDWEERTVAISETLIACLKKYRGNAPDDALIFPSPLKGVVDKHLDRIVLAVIRKSNDAGHAVKRPKKPCHACRVEKPGTRARATSVPSALARLHGCHDLFYI